MIGSIDILQSILALSLPGRDYMGNENQQENRNYRLIRSYRELFGERSVLSSTEQIEDTASPRVITRFGRLCLRPENDNSDSIGVWFYVGHGNGDDMNGNTSYKKKSVCEYTSESLENLRLNLEASGELTDLTMLDCAMSFMLMVRTVQLLRDSEIRGYGWLPQFDESGISSILRYEINDFNISKVA